MQTKKVINDEQLKFLSQWSGYRLAKMSGISEPTIYDFIRRKRFLDIQNLEALCKSTGITLSDFFALGEKVSK